MDERYINLVKHLDGILTQLEDNGTVSKEDAREARKELMRHGWTEKALGDLVDGESPTHGGEAHLLLVVSMSHLSEDDIDNLQKLLAVGQTRYAGPGIYADEYEHGFHVAMSDAYSVNEPWVAPTLKPIVAYARTMGATHLRIDNDGPIVSVLPTYQ